MGAAEVLDAAIDSAIGLLDPSAFFSFGFSRDFFALFRGEDGAASQELAFDLLARALNKRYSQTCAQQALDFLKSEMHDYDHHEGAFLFVENALKGKYGEEVQKQAFHLLGNFFDGCNPAIKDRAFSLFERAFSGEFGEKTQSLSESHFKTAFYGGFLPESRNRLLYLFHLFACGYKGESGRQRAASIAIELLFNVEKFPCRANLEEIALNALKTQSATRRVLLREAAARITKSKEGTGPFFTWVESVLPRLPAAIRREVEEFASDTFVTWATSGLPTQGDVRDKAAVLRASLRRTLAASRSPVATMRQVVSSVKAARAAPA